MFFLIATVMLFYIVALFQASFFSHFDILGTVPQILLITFIVLVFFDPQKKNNYYNTIIWAFAAGVFLDIFNYPYFGASIAILIGLGISIKKLRASLQENGESHPLMHFLIVFISSFVVYRILNIVLFNFADIVAGRAHFSWVLLIELVYTGLIATGIFYVIKRITPILNAKKKLQS